MIRCLIPDMPAAGELAPWLERIDSNLWYTNNGPLVCEFEQRLRGFIEGGQGAHCVTVSSGMSALELGLRALGIGAGHRVLMPALTFPATALAAARCGAEPVFADVCPYSWVMTPAIAREALTHGRIDALMPVAAFGYPLPADEWDALARETGLPVLVDAAAALGTQTAGTCAHWAFSLHATKPMGIGEGGLFVSPDGAVAEAVRRLANFSFSGAVVHSECGTNAKLSEYAAAVGLAQLERWPRLRERRRRVFDAYRRGLETPAPVTMQSNAGEPPATFCVHLPQPVIPIAEVLAQAGIETRRWYLPPLTRHPAFRGARRLGPGGSDGLPATDDLAAHLLGLPFHTRLSADDVRQVLETLAAALSAGGESAAPGTQGAAATMSLETTLAERGRTR
jgi:dTDP-4-amino-4,6-dideoxygalactose transaminase